MSERAAFFALMGVLTLGASIAVWDAYDSPRIERQIQRHEREKLWYRMCLEAERHPLYVAITWTHTDNTWECVILANGRPVFSLWRDNSYPPYQHGRLTK